MGADNVEFLDGLVERLPLSNGFADVVISNGVLNPSHALDYGTRGVSLRAHKPG